MEELAKLQDEINEAAALLKKKEEILVQKRENLNQWEAEEGYQAVLPIKRTQFTTN